MIFILLPSLSLMIWGYLLFFHGGFWHADQFLPQKKSQFSNINPANRKNWPSVAVIIPARNEAQSIRQVIESHLQSHYPGPFSLTLVNDHSKDQTAFLATKAANNDTRFKMISPPPLPKGWSGKLWALHHGLETVNKNVDYILFTDADIVHAPETLLALITKAETEELDMVSLMAKLDMRGIWGKTLIPSFVYFFMKLYPFKKVNDPNDKLAGAAGGCMLISYKRLQQTGSIETIKDRIIDDCSLAEKIKNTLPKSKIFLGLAFDEVISLRDNRSFASVWTMVTRTAYTQLDHSPFKLIVAIVGMILVYLVPPILLLWACLHHHFLTLIISLITFFFMLTSYWPTIRHYKLAPILILTLPISAFLYTAMTINSALQHWRGQGGRWKGRTY